MCRSTVEKEEIFLSQNATGGNNDATLKGIGGHLERLNTVTWIILAFYNEYKSKLLRRVKKQKAEIQATGGGPAANITLTPLQERLYDIIGRDVGEPLEGVRHNPLFT
ncbi:unnamed protein product [Arctia plantaginis]|uniref:Uncharacterized protein n=1 Tax=Arctia plantaginis TaxID=874455 RepID=A0A8S1ANN7_ARCPL|nr:unnamed protein product [Arctia plantaginis]